MDGSKGGYTVHGGAINSAYSFDPSEEQYSDSSSEGEAVPLRERSRMEYVLPDEDQNTAPLLSPSEMKGFSAYVTFSNVHCEAPSHRNIYNLFGLFGAPERKVILDNIHGVVKPGQLLAIIGPSGGGKTTLLDILAGRKKTGRVTGAVLVNGKPPQGRLWKRIAGYVMQDDVLYPSFTVRETLRYAARLRLPPSIPDWKKMQRVEQIMEELCLMEVADSLIGGEWIRGISGGEKRRVSIGIELVTDPSLLYLDEPTSGLDSYSAALVMELLRKMATTHNKTIICTIHQPSSLIFAKFDQLMILAPQGRLVYTGPAAGAVGYFEARGHTCPGNYNPADYFLELVSSEGYGKSAREKSEISVNELCANFLKTEAGEFLQADIAKYHVPARPKKRRSFLFPDSSPTYPSASSSSSSSASSGDEETPFIAQEFSFDDSWFPMNSSEDRREFANNAFVQFFILCQRNIVRYIRSPVMVAQFIFGYIFSALLLSLLFSELQTNVDEQLTLGIGFMLNIFSIMSFFAIPRYQTQRLLFNRERATGAYRTSVYLLSNILCQLPLDIITCIAYTAIDFYVIKFHGTFVNNTLFCLLVNFLTMEVYLGFNETIGASLERVDTALVLGGLSNISSLTLCGILVQYPNIPSWLRWAYWLSPLTYSVSAEMKNQFEDEPWVLDGFGLQLQDRWECVYILIGWMVFFRLTTYLALLFLQPEKR